MPPMTEASKMILVVDDDPLILEVLKLYLERAGHVVMAAENGLEAVSCLSQATPDVIILDIFMPEMDGLETLRQVKRGAPAAKVLAISGASSSHSCDFLSIAAKLGADFVLRKPFTGAQFVDCVEGLGRQVAQ